jgi:shikimate 5-dehydrogenase
VKQWSKFSSNKSHKKLAIAIHDFSELIEGHQWMMQDFENRSFLPMSDQGRWAWYRQWVSPKINFVRLGEGSAADQPTVLDVLNAPQQATAFAAILGQPVNHSLTPTYHFDFFKSLQAPVLRIDISEEEFSQGLLFLQQLGLKWAAVTSPLKTSAAQLVGSENPINTLCLVDGAWQGSNTDTFGLTQLIGDLKDQPVAVWGGGGVKESVRSVLPQASFYSSRTGELKSGQGVKDPQVVLWSVGAKNFQEKGVFPPSQWKPQWVVDLNYTQDSPGLECAHNYGCQYRSGLGMFQAQADKQQEFWRECRV